MKVSRMLSIFLLALVLCMTFMAISAFASPKTQDGLEASLTTDKESYSQGEDIAVTLSVKNTNNIEVNNVTLEELVPEGYKSADDVALTKEVKALKAGETASFTVTYVASTSGTNTENKDDTGNQNTDKSGTDSNNSSNTNNSVSNSGNEPKTGDNNNIVLWTVLLISFVVGIIVVLILKKKLSKRILSLFLCITMVGTFVTGLSTEGHAEESNTKSFNVQTEVSINGKILTINGNITYEMPTTSDPDYVDSDNDGLLDVDESAYGTDPLKPDTDNDGLSDYAELLLGTDPLTKNEYDEAIDSDEDGLLDVEEASDYYTNPFAEDTDYDGLSDYEEVKTYFTDPLSEDTDSDTLSDKFEIEHGLDPNSAYSDGTTYDGEKKINQNLTNSAIAGQLLNDDNIAKPQISGEAAGELSDNVFLATSTDTTLTDNRSVIGQPVQVDATSEYVKGLTLSFDLTGYDGDTNSLTIVSVDKDGNYIPMESSLSGNVLSTVLAENGTYLVLDIDEFLSALGIDFEAEDVSVTEATDSAVVYDGDNANAIFIETGEAETVPEETIETVSGAAEETIPEESIETIPEEQVETVEEQVETASGEMAEPVSEETVETVPEETVETVTEETVSEETTEMPSGEIMEVSEFPAEIDENLLVALDAANEYVASSAVSGQADIVFVIDTTGSMSSSINNVVTNVVSFADSLSKNYNVKVNYALIGFKDLEEDGNDTTTVVKNGSSNWYSDVDAFKSNVSTLIANGGGDRPECDIDALETARRLDWRTNANKFIILITDADYKSANNYGISSMDDEIELLSESGIMTSVVTKSDYFDCYQSLIDTTGGIYANINDSSFSSALLSLADLIGESTSDGTWVILKHGYRYVKITEDTDQDGDGLSTAYELGDEEEVDLTLFIKARLSSHGVPYEEYHGKTSITVYNAKSDPTKADTEDDGIMDDDDDAPWTKGYADGSIGEMNLLAVTGDCASAVAVEYFLGGLNSGHSFLIYQSYVNDKLDLSSWNGGYIANSGSWTGAIVQNTPTASYELKVNDVFAFSAGGNGDISNSCAVYNMEFYKHMNAPFYSYGDNRYITNKVTQAQLEKMMNVMKEEATESYDMVTHQCTHVSLHVWNTMYETNINPLGLNTPTNLYSWLNENGAKSNFNLDTIIH